MDMAKVGTDVRRLPTGADGREVVVPYRAVVPGTDAREDDSAPPPAGAGTGR